MLTVDRQTIEMFVLSVALVVAYGLSRTKFHRVGAVLAVVSLSGPSFYAMITATDYNARDITISLMWIALPVLLSGLVVSARGTILVIVGNLLGIALLWWFIPELTITALLMSLGFLMAVFVLTHFIAATHRQDIEQVLRRAGQLRATAEVSQASALARDLPELLEATVDHISGTFGFYHVQIFLLDPSGRMALLRASTGEVGQQLLGRGHRLPVGSLSVIGQVTSRGEPVIASNVGVDPIHKRNELLPNTRSEMALPLRVGERIIGALDVQSTEADAFTEEDVNTLQIMANQLAVSIENAGLLGEVTKRASDNERLLEEARANLHQIEQLNRSLTREGWREYLSSRTVRGTHGYTLRGDRVVEDVEWTPGMHTAIEEQRVVIKEGTIGSGKISLPLRVRGETVGVVEIEREGKGSWTEADVELVEALAERLSLALDNARLLEQADTLARREQLVNEITQSVQQAESVDDLLQSALAELGRVLGASRGVVQLSPKKSARSVPESPKVRDGDTQPIPTDSAVSEEGHV
jgi:GAF domain-containing protein